MKNFGMLVIWFCCCIFLPKPSLAADFGFVEIGIDGEEAAASVEINQEQEEAFVEIGIDTEDIELVAHDKKNPKKVNAAEPEEQKREESQLCVSTPSEIRPQPSPPHLNASSLVPDPDSPVEAEEELPAEMIQTLDQQWVDSFKGKLIELHAQTLAFATNEERRQHIEEFLAHENIAFTEDNFNFLITALEKLTPSHSANDRVQVAPYEHAGVSTEMEHLSQDSAHLLADGDDVGARPIPEEARQNRLVQERCSFVRNNKAPLLIGLGCASAVILYAFIHKT